MASSKPPSDPIPPSLSVLRRRQASEASARNMPSGLEAVDLADSVDFDALSRSVATDEAGPLDDEIGFDEVEALVQRYQAEKVQPEVTPVVPPVSVSVSRRTPMPGEIRPATGSFHGEVLRGQTKNPLPPLVKPNSNFGELERLRTENAELRATVAELKQQAEANDPRIFDEHMQEAERLLSEREAIIAEQQQMIEKWEAQLKTHRLVPCDDDLAAMSDELEKERCQLTQERKKLDDDRAQLQEDEESLMKQMREMEVGMARERADLARHRNELQRLQSEIKHELELLQRGDASVKDRLAQFQRRTSEALYRPTAAPAPVAPATPLPAAPMSAPPPKPKDSGVFKRLFGQNT